MITYRMKALIPLLLSFILFPSCLMGETSPETESPESTETIEALEPAVPQNRGRRDWSEDPKVYLIPVRQEIFHPQLFLLRRGVEQAIAADADAVVLLMDTPGGRVDVMREMVNSIIDLGIPTYTLVEDEAISAGAIIALATDHVYMTPRSTIGDAMPIMMGQELGEAEREKIESYMDAVVRSIAQAKGREEMLIRAMVRRNLEYKLEDGTVISKEGEILTLTNQEAERILPDGIPLLSEGTVEDLDNMLNRIGLGDAERIELLPSTADDLALWITRISPILISIALLLFYIEIQSPGIGWAGGLAALFFIIVVFGHNVAGLAGMEDLVLIGIGLTLIIVEIFVLPGFGIAGISGIICLVWGLIQAMSIRYPGNPGEFEGFDNLGNISGAVTNTGLSVIFTAIGVTILMRTLTENSLFGKRLVLASTLGDVEAPDTVSRSALDELIGQEGRAVTPLTPSGTVDLNGKEHDALSDAEFVEAGSAVNVVAVRNGRIIVASTGGTSA